MLLLGREVDGVPTFRDVGQQVPGLLGNVDHVVDAGVVLVVHLGEPEIRALAGVAGDDVVDDGAVELCRRVAHLAVLLFGAEEGIDAHRDPVEVSVDARCLIPTIEAASNFHRPSVDGVDADLLERFPQFLCAERAQERLTLLGDMRERVGGVPDRRPGERGARVRRGVRVGPHRVRA